MTTAALLEPTEQLPTVDPDGFPAPEPLGPAMTAPEPGGTAPPRPEAPHGLKADGTPRRRPGRPRKNVPPPKATPAPAPPRRGTGGKFTAASAKPDYTTGLVGLLTTAVEGAALLGMRRQDPVLIADAAAVAPAVPLAATAINAAAGRVPILAAGLEWLLKAGPHAGHATAGVVALAQVLVNHGKIPAGLVPGTVDPGELTEQWLQRAASRPDSLLGTVLRAAKATAG